MRSRLVFAAAALLGAVLLLPTPARAFSVDDVIQMHLDQFADSLIVLKIRNSGSVFHLEMKDLHRLKEAGVSDDVVAAMLNTEKPDDVPVLKGGTPLQSPPVLADSTAPSESTPAEPAPTEQVTAPDTAAKPMSDPITSGAPYYLPREHHYGLSDVYAPYPHPWYPYYSIPYYPGISFSLAFGFYGYRHYYPYAYPYRPVYVFPRGWSGGWGGGWGHAGVGPRFRQVGGGARVVQPGFGRPGYGYGKR